MGFRNPITHAIDQVARDAANAAATSIIPGSRLAADAIDGKTITGATVQTASSGLRWVMTGQAGDVDRLLGYTGAAGEQAPGQLQVGFSPGDVSSGGDRGFLYLNPPIIGPNYVAGRPAVTAYGSTRDATDPGHWQFDGAVEFTAAATFDGLVNGVRIRDTNWIAATPGTGWAGGTPFYRVLNAVCWLTFFSQKASYVAGEVFVSVPSAYAPSGGQIFTCIYGGTAKEVDVSNKGAVSLQAAGNNGVVGLISWPIGLPGAG